MLRGANDTIIYARREEETLQDLIYQVRIVLGDEGLEINEEHVITPAAMVGNIISLEFDPLDLMNVENVDQDNVNLEENKDHYDRIVIIDSKFSLFRI